MNKNSVPQDDSASYAGLRKLVYAVNEQGQYTGVPSSGWDVEAFATQTAVSELDRLRRDAWRRARDGQASPLEFHMYRSRMEPDTLAATTGLWRWRIRRHFRPARFATLSTRTLTRYADAMGVSVAELRALPEHDD